MDAKGTFFSKKHFLNIRGTLTDFSEPCVMGILNCTPDSFYSNSRVKSEAEASQQVERMLNEGAKIIDIGAYSSRPGADVISSEEEKERLAPILSRIAKDFPKAIISLDTFRAEIAQWAVETQGVAIINDISGGSADPKMFASIAKLRVPYVLMHMRGTPQTMQQAANYTNVVRDVVFELSEKTKKLCELGVTDIIIDPGFGFAKTLEQNYELMNGLHAFKYFEMLIMVGFSRKSMIYNLLGTTPENALNGTTVLNTIALQKGANILRVHDVKEAVEAIAIAKKTVNNTQFNSNENHK